MDGFNLDLKPSPPTSPFGCAKCEQMYKQMIQLYNIAKEQHEEIRKLKTEKESLKKENELFKPRCIKSEEIIPRVKVTKDQLTSNSNVPMIWIKSGGGVFVQMKTFEFQKDKFESFKNELGIMQMLSHPNIATCYGYSANKKSNLISIIREDVKGKNLFQCILDMNNKGKLSNKWKWKIIKEIVCAINFLHSKKVIHRNIKLESFHLTIDGQSVKLTDFGISKFFDSDKDMISCTPGLRSSWTAPETTGWSPTWSTKSDIFALAFVIYEIATQTRPVLPTTMSFDSQVGIGKRPPLPINLPTPFKFLIESCWQSQFTKRPTTMQLLKYIYEHEKDFN